MAKIGANARLGRITLTGQIRDAGAIPAMRVFGSYAAVYCFEGQAFYQDANGLQTRIGPGDMILVFPELAHRYGPQPGKKWSEIYLCFEGPVFNLWRKSGLLDSSQPILHLEPIDYWLKKFQSLLRQTRGPGLSPSVLEVCRLQQLLAEALLSAETGAISPVDLDWVSRACRLLEADLVRQTPMPAIARRLGLSYETFRKRFTRLIGITPARYRDERVIEQARRLMRDTDLKNKQIADRLGFCDEFHFSHRFKQLTGRWPRQFRKSMKL